MLIYEYKLDGSHTQYQAIDEAIRVTQFIRNKCLRLWMDERGISKNDLQIYCALLAREYPFANHLNSQARQVSADRAWFAISRFYDNCKTHKPGKKGYPRFQHDNRSAEYKQTGWKLEPDGKHIIFTDGCGIGRLRLVGNPKQKIEVFPVKQIKRVRILHRADGYYVQLGVQAERCIIHQPTDKQVGIDVGLKAFLTDSEGKIVENPRHYRKAEKRLKRLHRQLSRKQKKSNNRKKARKQLAKAYGLMHSIPIIAVAPQFTSQTCSNCGALVKKSLSMRTHICTSCGLVMDRDQNAALNILSKALERTVGHTGTSEPLCSGNASGQTASTRLSQRKMS
jgi:putative transposase